LNQDLNASYLIELFQQNKPALKIFRDKTRAQFDVGAAIEHLIDAIASKSPHNGGFDRKEFITILKSVTARYAEELSKDFTGSKDSVVLYDKLYERSWREISNWISKDGGHLFDLRQVWLQEIAGVWKQKRSVSTAERLYSLCEYFRIDLSDLRGIVNTIRAIG